jgi:nicotinamidase/pyrazinamidase
MPDALVIVDVQRDFCPGGALPAPAGNDVVPVINGLMDRFEWIIASKDWHPSDTKHFEKWPPHCIRGTRGADFHPDLDERRITALALKGTGSSDDGYSAFEATNLDLSHWLRKNNIDTVCVTGIATEYCVFSTAMDAVRKGFQVYVVRDAVAAVNRQEGDQEQAFREMAAGEVKLVTAAAISGSRPVT